MEVSRILGYSRIAPKEKGWIPTMKKLTSFILSALLCVSTLAALPQAFCCDGSGASPTSVGVINPEEPGVPEPHPAATPGEGSGIEEPLQPNAPGGHNGDKGK